MTATEPPTLAPPGAGLPVLEAFLSKHLLFPLFCALTPWERCSGIFAQEGAAILHLVDNLTAEQLAKPVLIKRISGIEDSSRFWSPAMTLEHLIIVGTKVMAGIVALGRGQVPSERADVAKVKPTGILTGDPVALYRDFLRRYSETLARDVDDRHSPTRYCHPWFGPLNARQWNAIGALHQRIHRRQIEAILHS